MGDYDEPRPPGRARSGRGLAVVAAIAALAVGLAGGYLLRAGTEASTVATAPPSSTPRPPSTTAAPPPPASRCLEIADLGGAVVVQLESAARSLAALDPSGLRAVLGEVQRLRDELRRDVDACRAQAGGSEDTADPPTPTPAAPSMPMPTSTPG